MPTSRSIYPPPRVRARLMPVCQLTDAQIAALTNLRKMKREVAAEVERLIAFLDMIEGYTLSERELVCEDEGAQCDDEGADSDREPEVAL